MYTSSGVQLKWCWSVFLLVSDLSGILVYTYDIRSVVGVYTPVGVAIEWLWSVHSVRVRATSQMWIPHQRVSDVFVVGLNNFQ